MRNLIFVFALAASPALAGSYSAADAVYVTDSRDPDVLNYVVCLATNSDNDPMKLDAAIVSCSGLAARVDANVAADIRDGAAECGFRPDGDPNDDMGCE